MLELMILPFLACLILIGIHVYFGIHVIEREVIFVDLALAQLAALGRLIAFITGADIYSTGAYILSLLFTFLGAVIFSRVREKAISQEAIIGIVYAVSAACAILVLDRVPSEAEHIKYMLVGNILFVKWHEIIKIAILYTIIGSFHYFFRDKFLLISLNIKEAKRQNIAVKWWDFLFYVSFGVVITSSVEIAGVLLVFSYLIVPAVCAMLLSPKLKTRLLIGWILGTLTNLFGLYLSAIMDLPPGATIVCSFGPLILATAGIRSSFLKILSKKSPPDKILE